MKSKVIREILSWIGVLAFAILLAKLLTTFVILNERIPSGSMENTIMTNDTVFTFRLSYLFSEPKRGDIIVFPYPDNENIDYIKRVVGLPGETVEIKEGVVYIDGDPLDEPYVKEEWHMLGDAGVYEVPEDSYFVMGDNRNSSEDSRYWRNKFVEEDKIKSKYIFTYPKWFGFWWKEQ